jgi:hypothetical protein
MARCPAVRIRPRSRRIAHRRSAGARARVADQQRLDDPPHPRLAQLVGELIQMGVAALDQGLGGLVDGLGIDGAGAIAQILAAEGDLVADGVDQPGLAAGPVPDARQRIGVKGWPVSSLCCR